MLKEKAIEAINETYGENAQYILTDGILTRDIRWMGEYEEEGNERFAAGIYEDVIERAAKVNETILSPVTAKVGNGVTVNLYSDRHAATIIKRTKCTITVQYDKAVRNPDFVPQWDGMYCTNQSEQTYTYERDENGRTETFRWSNKYNRYQGGGDGSITVSNGRHEFYDYNF